MRLIKALTWVSLHQVQTHSRFHDQPLSNWKLLPITPHSTKIVYPSALFFAPSFPPGAPWWGNKSTEKLHRCISCTVQISSLKDIFFSLGARKVSYIQLSQHLLWPSLPKDFPGRDPEPEGPGPGAAPRPDQAPLHHQHGQNGRDPGQVAARRQSDHRAVLGRGNYESHVRRGESPWWFDLCLYVCVTVRCRPLQK